MKHIDNSSESKQVVGEHRLGRLVYLLHHHPGSVLACLIALSGWVVFGKLIDARDQVIKEAAIENARMLSRSLGEFRKLYTDQVIRKLGFVLS